MRQHWSLDTDVVFLNHGAFGACPIPVLEAQTRYRAELEREPVHFFERRFLPLLDVARERVAAFVGARPEDMAFVNNATAGVNAILRSLEFAPGDAILTTDHAYNACKNTLDYVARRSGATVIVVRVPLPLVSADEFAAQVFAAATPRVRLALLDHVTSPTGLVLPIEALVRGLRERGVETLVDGAHGPGMLPLSLTELDAAYYVGNLHKWVCAPKGAAFLWARADRQEDLHPNVISHGLAAPGPRPQLWKEFDWTGSDDPSPWLAAPDAIDFIASLCPGGWPEVRRRNRELALSARALLSEALGAAHLAPESMLESLVAIPLPDGAPTDSPNPDDNPLHLALYERHGIQVPVFSWPSPPRRHVRVAAHIYNELWEYERLASALKQELGI